VQTFDREGSPLVKLRNSGLTELIHHAAVGRMLPVLDFDPVPMGSLFEVIDCDERHGGVGRPHVICDVLLKSGEIYEL
jgi:hypothetical protein